MAQLAQQLAAVQAERDRLAEQVAVLRSIPDAPLAAGARRQVGFPPVMHSSSATGQSPVPCVGGVYLRLLRH